MLRGHTVTWSCRALFAGSLLGSVASLACGGNDDTSVAPALPGDEGTPALGDDGAGDGEAPGDDGDGDVAGDGDGEPNDNEGDEPGTLGDSGIVQVYAGVTGAANVRNLYGLAYSSVGEHAGKLYASGVGGEGNVVVLRFLADGGLDTSFGEGGVVDTGQAGNSYGVLELADGTLIVQGNGGGEVFLLKLDAAGALDDTFGRVAVLAWSADDRAALDAACTAAAADAEDAEVVAGCTDLWPAAVAPEFSQRPNYTAWDIQLDTVTTPGTEKIVVLAYGAPARAAEGAQRTDDDRWVARVLASDGSLDPDFNGGASVTVDVAGLNANDGARRGLLESDGSIVSGGYTNFGDGNNAILLRLNPDGSADEAFGFDTVADPSTLQPGLTRFNPFVGTGAMAEVYSIARQESGRYVTTGYGISNLDIETIENDLVSFGVLAGGLDPLWGQEGAFVIQSETDQATIESGTWDGGRAFRENGRDLLLLPDGRTFQVGCYNDYAAVFVTGVDGAFDQSFGAGGRLVFDAAAEDTHTAPFFAVTRSSDGRVATTAQGDFLAIFELEAE